MDSASVVRRMPDDLANQIAAGEVVERPASVVKELVENALDAGATRIRIELDDGGLKLIRVTDNGRGMSPDDAALCIERHATSKLRTRDDLFAIRTLGFRGEALPSIASVSHFELITKPHGAIGGTRVRIDGGTRADVTETGAAPGTEITVRDLFFNTPARLKFLKQRSTELRHVIDTVWRVAIPNPTVAFTVKHNGRVVLDAPAAGSLRDRVFALVGADEAAQLFAMEHAEQDGVSCHGLFSAPTLQRRTADGLWTFVNGRFVRDRTIQSAVRVAYEGLLDRARHPLVVAIIDMPPESVDVNVHPTKIEVRFHQSDAVFRAVRRAIRTAAARAPWVPEGAARPELAGDDDAPRFDADAESTLSTQADLPVREYVMRASSHDGAPNVQSPVAHVASYEPSRPANAFDATRDLATSLPTRSLRGEELPPRRGFFSSLNYIGAFRGTYLLNADSDGLVIVDQHASHERITFERLRSAWAGRTPALQQQLIPQAVSLDSIRAATLADNIEVLGRLGYEIEPFGGGSFAVRTVPAILLRARHDLLLRDALDELGETGRARRVDDAIDAVLLRMACHSSVRAGDQLAEPEVRRLYRELDEVDFGGNCPHGRPVWFRMSLAELETRFERR